MLEGLLDAFEKWNKRTKLLDRLEDDHPLLGMLLFQIVGGLLMVATVSGIAFAGGAIIWMFVKLW